MKQTAKQMKHTQKIRVAIATMLVITTIMGVVDAFLRVDLISIILSPHFLGFGVVICYLFSPLIIKMNGKCRVPDADD